MMKNGFYLFASVLLCTSFNSNAKRMVIPLVGSGKQVFLAAEVELVQKEEVKSKINSITKVGQDFLALVKKSDRKDISLFSKHDGSALKWQSPKVYEQYAGFSNVDEVIYSDPILWGSYIHAPTIYSVAKNKVLWREDYLCLADTCKKSLHDFGQLFEVAYKNHIKEPNASFFGNVETAIVQSKKKQLFDMSNFLPLKGRKGPEFKVGMAITPVLGAQCVLCDEEIKYTSDFEKSVDVFDNESLTEFLKKNNGLINPRKGMPKVKWSGRAPSLSHVDYIGYLREWQRYTNGSVEGYMLDDDYAYLFVSRKLDGLKEKQFQIFVLKENSQGVYDLFPHTDKALNSRALMFDAAVLNLISTTLGV